MINLPWGKTTEDKLDLEAARDSGRTALRPDASQGPAAGISGGHQARKQIKGPILCLVGPPGVGKTSLGKSVADSLGRKFARISLGGMRDEAEIRGHRRTYVGALPGRIMQALRRAESRNPVILLDELDKVGADFRGDPAVRAAGSAGPGAEQHFHGPLSGFAVRSVARAVYHHRQLAGPDSPGLRDRLEVIELPSYTESEKLQIASASGAAPARGTRAEEEAGTISRRLAAARIEDYTREAGVRQLEREIAALTRKAARKIVSRNGDARPLTLAPEIAGGFSRSAARFTRRLAENITETASPPGWPGRRWAARSCSSRRRGCRARAI